MLIFAYKYSANLENKTKILKDVLIHKNEIVKTTLNKLYYEDNFVANINDSNLVEKYLENNKLVIEVPISETKKIDNIKKMFDNILREIDYSVVSRGTEINGNKGYIAISKPIDNNRFLLVQDHKERFITTFKDSLECQNHNIKNIAFSRFEMISVLSLKKMIFKDKILLCGIGNIGISCLIYLLDNGYKNIDILNNETKKYISNIINKLNSQYNSNIELIHTIKKEYETYIDTTGKSIVIEQIFNNIGFNKVIFLIGTPRESTYLIDPLLIHRNNLILIGGHELNGISLNERKKIFKSLLCKNEKNKIINEIVNINPYRKNILEKLLNNKSHFIEVIEYDD